MQFLYEADREHFQRLLCDEGRDLSDYSMLFDSRPPREKRIEFNSTRQKYLALLTERFGQRCMLKIAADCDVNSGLQVDHIIPLSSNVLNRLLRSAGTSRDSDGRLRKASAQSIGSNHLRNLALACRNCNSLKRMQSSSSQGLLRAFQVQGYRETIFARC